MTNSKSTFYSAADIMELLDVSRSKAYKVIKDLNAELREKGYLVIDGRVSRKYFNQRFYDYDMINNA